MLGSDLSAPLRWLRACTHEDVLRAGLERALMALPSIPEGVVTLSMNERLTAVRDRYHDALDSSMRIWRD